jgi:hypothetical protein
MNRFIYGRGWVFEDETNGDGSGAGGGARPEEGGVQPGTPEGEAAPDTGTGAAPDAGGQAGGKGKEGAPQPSMKDAIDAALGYKKGPQGEVLDPTTGKPKETKPAPEQKPDRPVTDKWPNGKPKKDAQGRDLDENGKPVAKQPKTAAELDMKPEELKTLGGPKAQERFREVIGVLKEREATVAQLTEANKELATARDEMLGVLQDTKTTQDELAGYLEFNSMLKSGDPRQLEEALKIIENQRLILYKALGKEPAGGDLDLLADFPDLTKDVEESRLTRERALEIANGRRDRVAREEAERRAQHQSRSEQQTAEQQKKASDTALAEIEKWALSLGKNDLDYKAKEAKLIAKVPEVIKSYPPNLWLSTLKMVYEGIEIQKAPALGARQQMPLRPTGATPGAKAPASMLEAINQGLGYAKG